MASEAFWGGFILYLLEIFLPGIGFGELFRIWRKEDTFIERVGIYFGLGLAVDTIVLMFRTSKLGGLQGIDSITLYGVILLGGAAIAISIAKRRTIDVPKLTRSDLILAMLFVIQVLMITLYFSKYPIFPEYQSQDYSIHVQLAQSLISGSVTSIPSGILYYGVHYQLASGILLVGGEPLITARYVMAILVVLSQFLFYAAAKRIFSNTGSASIVAAIYVLSGTIWFGSVFNSGLYANFYGILATLFLVVALISVSSGFSISSLIIFLISVVNAYFSHYTLLTILPAVLFVALLQFFVAKEKRSEIRNYLIPAIMIILPAVVPLIIFPGLGQRILQLAASGGGVLTGGTILSNALSGIPVLGYLVLEVYDDVAFVALVALTAVYLYRILPSRNVFFYIPIVWFLTLMVAAPADTSAWRFSFEALVPLTFMAGYGLWSFLPDSEKKTRGKTVAQRAKSGQQASLIPRILVLVIFLGAIIVGSWGQSMLFDAVSSQSIASQSQNAVYNAIYWLKGNTSSGSQYLSVSDWRFTFTDLLIGRTTFYQYERVPSDAIHQALSSNASYIIVTDITTLSLPPAAEFYPWNNFPSSSTSNLSLMYQNSDVRIYHIVNAS